MAPPKRKTGGGRVTPKGTQPSTRTVKADGAQSAAVEASARYTPKATRRQLIPPTWIPVIMVALLIGGGLAIMARYLFWDTNTATLLGLALIAGGLVAATKWE